jgi:hypothetical protein
VKTGCGGAQSADFTPEVMTFSKHKRTRYPAKVISYAEEITIVEIYSYRIYITRKDQDKGIKKTGKMSTETQNATGQSLKIRVLNPSHESLRAEKD